MDLVSFCIIICLLLYILYKHLVQNRNYKIPKHTIVIPIKQMTPLLQTTLRQIQQITQSFQLHLNSNTNSASNAKNSFALLEDVKQKFILLEVGIEYQQKLLDCFVTSFNHSPQLTPKHEHQLLEQLLDAHRIQAKEMWRQIELCDQEYKLGKQQLERIEQLWNVLHQKLTKPSSSSSLTNPLSKYKEEEEKLSVASPPKFKINPPNLKPVITTPSTSTAPKTIKQETQSDDEGWD